MKTGNDLLQAARPYLRALSLAMGREAHLVALTDQRGEMIDTIGKDFIGDPSEGIGLALEEKRYVELLVSGNVCQSIPVFSATREVVGAVAILYRGEVPLERLHEILLCVSHGIEAEQIRILLDKKIDSFLADSRDLQIMESLRQDIMQLHASMRLKLERAASLLALSEGSNVLRLISGAVKLSSEFRQMAGFWLELATNDSGDRQPILLDKKIRELLYLLETEFSTKNACIVSAAIPSIWIRYEMRNLSRELLRGFMRIIAVVEPKDQVKVEVRTSEKYAEVALEIVGKGTRQILKYPLMVRLQKRLRFAPMLPFFS